MAAFAGIVRFDGAPVDRDIEHRLANALAAQTKSRVAVCRADGAVFVQRMASGAHGRLAAPGLFECRDGVFTASARLDNRDALAAALGVASPAIAGMSDAEFISAMLERRGDAGVAHCLGAFAFARWEPGPRRLILGRDCLGQRGILFHRDARYAVFSNMIGVLLALPEVPRAIDEEILASFLVLNHEEPRRTLYRGIERTPRRSLMTIDRAGARHRIYWSPNLDATPPYRRDEDYIERARELFDRAVAACLAGTPNFAISTSGGLDSSAIAATVARLNGPNPVACFTLVPPTGFRLEVASRRYLDERDKIQALGRMYPTLNMHLVAPEGLHPLSRDDTLHFAKSMVPAVGALMLGQTSFLRDAIEAAGHSVLLTGSAGNAGLSWDGRSSLLALLRAGQWQTFAHELGAIARESGLSRHSVFRSLVLSNGAPAGLRDMFHRMRGRDPNSPARYSALNPDYIAARDLPRNWRAQGFEPWFRPSGWSPARFRAKHLFDYAGPQTDGIDQLRESGGLEVRDPHADRRLLEFALQVPEPLYRRNGVPRSFARAVFADRLPREILLERRRGYSGGGPWFRNLALRKQDIAADIERMAASATASRLIDVPRLKRLLDEWPQDEQAAEAREQEYKLALGRAVHVGRFIRWVEGGNA